MRVLLAEAGEAGDDRPMAERLFLRLPGDPLHAPETGVPRGTLRDIAVAPGLHPWLAHITVYREMLGPGQEVVERVLPDGAAHLIVHLAGVPAAPDRRRPLIGIAGATALPALLRLKGEQAGLSVRLQPGAASALFGVPAGELTDRMLPLDALWGAGETETLVEGLGEGRSDAQRVACLQRALLRRLRGHRPPGQAAQAVRLIAESDGRRSVRSVADAVGVGERRLQQLFHAEVGLSPRGWSRIARLHACLRALRTTATPRWAELALDSGYCDQSHLANEFRALCGLSPSLFLRRSISGSSKTRDGDAA
ncbi:helix-turn-helix domain-containing protein [Ideonella sp. YS5]|uniref:helix-turn-helix transcriptional regulator n=1 Tax=Ideonella sp. YS5 TaxID=3453714 RepID=UPI003EEB26CB